MSRNQYIFASSMMYQLKTTQFSFGSGKRKKVLNRKQIFLNNLNMVLHHSDHSF